jgi:hypothetical protein
VNFVLATIALLAFEPAGSATSTSSPGSSPAAESRGEPRAAANAAETGAERRICRRIDSSESRMSRRLCLTAREWRDRN